jgi:hypothetical protein
MGFVPSIYTMVHEILERGKLPKSHRSTWSNTWLPQAKVQQTKIGSDLQTRVFELMKTNLENLKHGFCVEHAQLGDMHGDFPEKV